MARRLVRAVRRAWRDDVFRAAALGVAVLIIGATIFYTINEGWSVVDSLYFAVSTGLTIGFGDLTATTTVSKIFTTVYSLLAAGLFVTIAAGLAKSVISGTPRHDRHRKHQHDAETSDESDEPQA